MSKHVKIQATTNYKMFGTDDTNRAVELPKHKALMESMKLYGFLPSFPIVVRRGKGGQWIVRDGQHRLHVAAKLGLPVYWVEEPTDFCIAVVNSTAKTWTTDNYASMYAKNGHAAYEEGLAFAARHKMKTGCAFALLAGKSSYSFIQEDFKAGKFKIRERALAETVAGIYTPMVGMCKELNRSTFVEACLLVCQVNNFDVGRLLSNATRCRDKLVGYPRIEPLLHMLEDVYNYHQRQLKPLKVEAIALMRKQIAKTKTPFAKAVKQRESSAVVNLKKAANG